MKKVLAGGAFSIIHPGHLFFLERAGRLGNYLVVVVANDRTVSRSKGLLVMKAEARKKVLESLSIVDKAVIGDEKDFMKVVRRERPRIIALGYDQELGLGMRKQIEKRGIRIVRIKSRLKGYRTRDILKPFETRGA
jgi:FAD synthetase